MNIPQCEFGLIGGSSTLSIRVPEDLDLDYVKTLSSEMVFETPYGPSPEFKLLSILSDEGERTVLSCQMHGWRQGVSRANASRQVFWVFKNAGVHCILAEGGVGAINHLLRPRDIVVPHDYMDFSMRKDVGLEDRHLLVMREAMCPSMRNICIKVCEEKWAGRVFNRSIYANTDGRHFESPAEVNMYKIAGADVVGQSICPEVYLAREIGACYTGIYLVVNYAEGVVTPWEHEELADIFYNKGDELGRILLESLRRFPAARNCQCASLRKDTLLKQIYE